MPTLKKGSFSKMSAFVLFCFVFNVIKESTLLSGASCLLLLTTTHNIAVTGVIAEQRKDGRGFELQVHLNSKQYIFSFASNDLCYHVIIKVILFYSILFYSILFYSMLHWHTAVY